MEHANMDRRLPQMTSHAAPLPCLNQRHGCGTQTAALTCLLPLFMPTLVYLSQVAAIALANYFADGAVPTTSAKQDKVLEHLTLLAPKIQDDGTIFQSLVSSRKTRRQTKMEVRIVCSLGLRHNFPCV